MVAADPVRRAELARAAAQARWAKVTDLDARRDGTAKARQAFAEKLAADPDHMAALADLSVRSRRRRWVAATAADTIGRAA